MTIEEQLKSEILSRYKSIAAFTSAIGVPNSTLNSVFKRGISNAGISTMIKVFNALDLDVESIQTGTLEKKQSCIKSHCQTITAPEELFVEEHTHIKKYRSLDPYGKEAVDKILDVEWRRCTQLATVEQPEPEKVRYITKWFPTMPMSAGTGQPAGYEEAEELELTKRPPRSSSFVAPVSGDSMEPTFHDGDKLFIRICEEIEPGQIGVFYMDGQMYVKELGDTALISHNPDYDPIPMQDDIRCQGLVLGVCDESYFE